MLQLEFRCRPPSVALRAYNLHRQTSARNLGAIILVGDGIKKSTKTPVFATNIFVQIRWLSGRALAYHPGVPGSSPTNALLKLFENGNL